MLGRRNDDDKRFAYYVRRMRCEYSYGLSKSRIPMYATLPARSMCFVPPAFGISSSCSEDPNPFSIVATPPRPLPRPLPRMKIAYRADPLWSRCSFAFARPSGVRSHREFGEASSGYFRCLGFAPPSASHLVRLSCRALVREGPGDFAVLGMTGGGP
jgi:hypothetical protein